MEVLLVAIAIGLVIVYYRLPSTWKRKDRRVAQKERSAARAEDAGRAVETAFIESNSELIAALNQGGHSLRVTTHQGERQTFLSGYVVYYVTTLQCKRCGKKYPDEWGGVRRELSPERPCKGDGSA